MDPASRGPTQAICLQAYLMHMLLGQNLPIFALIHRGNGRHSREEQAPIVCIRHGAGFNPTAYYIPALQKHNLTRV